MKFEKRRARLMLLRDRFCDGNNAELARKIGKDGSYVTRLMYPEGKPGKKRIGEDITEAAEKAFGLPRGWLDFDGDEISNIDGATIGQRKIPLISYVQAGLLTDAADPYVVGDADDWLLTDMDLSANAFALKIRGESMAPDFREGDVILIDPAIEPLPGDFVVAKNGENEATFKRFRPRGMNERGINVIELVPVNPDYPSIRSDISPVTVIGTMVEHRRYRKK